MLRKILLVGVAFIFVLTLLSNCAYAKEAVQWKTYKGAWFEVFYPSDFVAKPSLISKNKLNEFDSISFAPLNQSVEFYVFAPLYGYSPEDIGPRSNENQVSSVEKKKGLIITRTTVYSDKEGKYVRTVIDTTDTGPRNTFARHCFGFKYSDKATFEAYNKVFQQFQKSLVQMEK
ncbi:MAG: hypothetical protein HQM08_06525 [Candidatus Riflebacteria bacterium]|nr:hypothetical protein [Candidatus Riflebacteria bacterium]